MWIYQELPVRTRPDVAIEARARTGGSALFLAMVPDQIGRGQAIPIDTEHWETPE